MRNPIVNRELSPFEYQEVWEHNNYSVDPADIEGKPLLDVGAHYGFFSLLGLHFGCTSVTAVEPNVAVLPGLREHLSPYPEAKIVEAAMTGDGKGIVTLNRSVVCPKIDVIGDLQVAACSLESCMPEGDDISLKMDIEFAEYDVLFNAPGYLLRRFKTIFIEIHEEGRYVAEAMRKYLDVLGFEMVNHSPMMHWESNANGEPINMRRGGAETDKFKRR